MTELATTSIDHLTELTPPIASARFMPTPSEADALRVQLAEAQKAQQTAEIALAHEREANIAEGVRAMIDNAIRERTDAYNERDRMRLDLNQSQAALGKAQHAVQRLEQQVATLMCGGSRLRPHRSQHSVDNSCHRYSPLDTDYARRNHHPTRAPHLLVTPTFPLLNTALGRASVVNSAASSTSKHIFGLYLTTETQRRPLR